MAKSIAFSAVTISVLLTACAVGPDYQRPVNEFPEAWAAHDDAVQAADSAGAQWWRLYGDPVLEQLVDEALSRNADIQVAAARVSQARAQAGLTDADRAPVVFASASADRTRSSEDGAFPLPSGTPRIQNNFRATLEASYEVDLWGKYRRASEAARAELLAADSAQQAVRLSLVADVIQQYVALLAADQQAAAAQRVLASRGESLELLRRRLTAGVASKFDLHVSEAEEAAARSQLAAATQSQARQEAVLAVLLGRSPREVMTGTVARGAPAAQTALWVPAGLPSDLLLRRPDIRQAEQLLIAANARIGVARSQVFPSISLTGFVGSESTDLSNLFSGPAGIFQFAAAVTQPIFNAGRTTHALRVAEAQREQALAQYRQAVANAFRDVRLALAGQEAARVTLQAETQRAAALSQAYKQAGLRYEGGISSKLDVLDVERQLLQAEFARIDALRAQHAAVADLFKALGGGWPAAETVQRP